MRTLVRRGDADALVTAARYQDLTPTPGGGTVDRGVEVRQEAILALGGMGPEVGLEAITAALSDPSDQVRVAAVRVLYARQEAVPLAAALAWLPRDRGEARVLTMKALAKLRRPDAAPALAAAMVHAQGDDPVGEHEAALLTMLIEADEGWDAGGEVVEQLLTALADVNDAVSDRAEELLALIAPTSIDGLIAELKAGAASDRAAAVLARIRDTRALEPLIEALLHRDARVRAESATALGELRDPAAVEALIHATRDSDHRVRAQAGAALDQLGMVALVVGVSTLLRPMISEAVSAGDSRPALLGSEQASGAGNGTAPEHALSETNGETPGQPPEPASADLLDRLATGTDDVPGIVEPDS